MSNKYIYTVYYNNKQLPSMLAERLSELSCNQHIFNNATVVHQEAMQKSGYHDELKVPAFKQSYHTDQNEKKRKENEKFYGSSPFQ